MDKLALMFLALVMVFSPVFAVAEEAATAPAATAAAPAVVPAVDEALSAADELMGEDEEGEDYSYGTVKAASATEITINQYDYWTDQEADVTYAIDPAVQLENLKAVTDIKAGDSIEVNFVEKDGKKVATWIALEVLPDEEEVAPAAEAPAPVAPAPVQ